MRLGNPFGAIFALIIIALYFGFLIFSPFLFALLWYWFIVHEPISAAIIGVVCGLIADFFVLIASR